MLGIKAFRGSRLTVEERKVGLKTVIHTLGIY